MGIRLLIVDDEELLRDNLARFFTRKGFDVAQAGSGNQAIEVLTKQEFDLIISDMKMPDGDGLFLYEKTRQLNPLPNFIFLTGFSETSEQDLMSFPGVCLVENKPVEKKALLAKINLLLGQS